MRQIVRKWLLALSAAGLASSSPVFAQSPVLGGGDQSVGDVEYCQDGECVVIGKKRKKRKASEPETHVFPPGGIPRKENNRKVKKYFYDNLQEAIDRVSHNGVVKVHPGVHDIGTVTIDGPPRTITIKAIETSVGRAYLQSPSQKCIVIDPDFSDDPARTHPIVTMQNVSIIANAAAPEASFTTFSADSAPACVDSSRVELYLDRVEINTNGDGVALRVRNKKAKIAQSRLMSSRLQIEPPKNVADERSLKPPAPAAGIGIDVANLAELELIGGGRNGSTIAGFETGVEARGRVVLSDASFKNNRVGVRLRQIDDMMMSMASDTTDAASQADTFFAENETDEAALSEEITVDNAADNPSAVMIRDSEILLAESDAAAGVQSIGVAVDDDYNLALVLNNVEIIDIFNVNEGADNNTPNASEERLIATRGRARAGYASPNGGIGLLGGGFQAPPIISGGGFRHLAIGADVSSSTDFVGAEFQQNNTALVLNYKGNGPFAADGILFALDDVKFDGNKYSLDLEFEDTGELLFSNVVLAPSPLEKIRRRKGETFIPGRNEINAPIIRNRRARYPLTCDGDAKSDLYKALTKRYICKISD